MAQRELKKPSPPIDDFNSPFYYGFLAGVDATIELNSKKNDIIKRTRKPKVQPEPEKKEDTNMEE